MPSDRRRAVTALLAACTFWGGSFSVTKALCEFGRTTAPHLPSWFVAAHTVGTRFLAASLLLAVLLRTRPTRSEWVQGVQLGAITGVGMLLQADGLAHTSASVSAFLTQGYVVFLPIVSTIATRRAPPGRVIACAALVLLGLGVLARFDPRTLTLGRGEAETLAAAACFTVQILLVGTSRFEHNRPNPMTAVMFAVTGLVLVPVVVAFAKQPADYVMLWSTPASAGCFAFLVAVPTLAAFVLMNRFQRGVTPSEAGIVYAMEPVVASVLGLFAPALLSRALHVDYGNETVDARLVLGGGLVVGANVLLSVTTRAPD